MPIKFNGVDFVPSVFVSPSVQDFNQYIDGGNEKYYMNIIADELIMYLNASNIKTSRNKPNQSINQAIEQSNNQRCDLYISLHSNIAPPEFSGTIRGVDIYYNISDTEGKKLAEKIADNYTAIYEQPNLINVYATAVLNELNKTNSTAVLIETAYHDNREDAQWIRENISAIARNLALSITEYMNLTFIEP